MKQPNIITLMIDDLGWSDLGCYGSRFYETPNLDRLAAEGLRLTDAYATCPVCSPSRASFHTGRYPARVGVTDWIDHEGYHPCSGLLVDAPYHHGLPPFHTCVAQALREAGYATWHVGKWHLGGMYNGPERYGFDINIGGGHRGAPNFQAGGYFSPYGLENLVDGPEGEYLSDRLTDEAISLIHNRDPHCPFFLNLCHYAVHGKIQAKPADVARFAAKAKVLGLDQVNPFEEGEFFPCAHKKTERVKRRMLQSDPDYAAMMWNLDENIGRILDTVRSCGMEEETFILFTSDNGGLATAEGSPTSNLPLAEGKGWMYDGGVRVPFIACWPGHVPEGVESSIPVTGTDFYPTFLSLAGAPARPAQHCDGMDLSGILLGGKVPAERPLFWHYPHYGNQGGTPGAAIRYGDWKLILFYEENVCELYHISDDKEERINCAGREPEQVRLLRSLLDAWLFETGAIHPAVNPAFAAWKNRGTGRSPHPPV